MADEIRFYLDEHVAHAVAHGLAKRGVDVLTALAANMLTATDIQHLDFARSEYRVLLSQDTDFLRLHAAGAEHFGIVYAPQQTAVGSIVNGLMVIYEVLTPVEMQNHVEFL
jgi:hypothetical protein